MVSLVAHKSRYTTARPLAAAGHSPNYNQLSSRIVALLIIYTRPEVSTHTDIDIYTHNNRHLHTARDIYTRPEISTHGQIYLQGESKKSGISKSMYITLRAIKIKQIKF